MTVGMGFIALALTMVGGWNPYRILVAAVLFGMLRSLGNGLQILGIDIRTEFIDTCCPISGSCSRWCCWPGERRCRRPSACRTPGAVAEELASMMDSEGGVPRGDDDGSPLATG